MGGRTVEVIQPGCPVPLDGDRLKVCYDLSGQARPTRFEAKEKTPLFLAEYERVKP
jgi:hypothetical protein